MEHLFPVNCIEKKKIKKKRQDNGVHVLLLSVIYFGNLAKVVRVAFCASVNRSALSNFLYLSGQYGNYKYSLGSV